MTVRLACLHLACWACDSRHSADVSAGDATDVVEAWWGAHRAPVLEAVECTRDGEPETWERTGPA